MNEQYKDFIIKYSRAIQEGYAAVFAGAGLSQSCGFVNWTELLAELVSQINLDVNKENDLVEVAQYVCNEKNGRTEINTCILNSFSNNSSNSESLDILVNMPIDTFWTTNYDSLLEDGLRKQNKKVDVKITPESLAVTMDGRDAIVYKMHGDYQDASKCVIIKDDYETYNQYRQLFSTALQGELVSKTFLFIGFSFDDPNLKYILGRIRVLLGENRRNHYILLKKVTQGSYNTTEEYNYAKIKQELKINDLLRYGINAIIIDSYSDIPVILKQISKIVKSKNVFISGAANSYGEKWENTAIIFIRKLTKLLYNKNYKIITGHGRGVGSYIISTVLEQAGNSLSELEKHLLIKAFPYEDEKNPDYINNKTKYRKGIAEISGISIFMFGNKLVNGKEVLAEGMKEEFNLANQMGNYIIPIGSTGYVANEICENIKNNIDDYPYLKNEINILSDSEDYEAILDSISRILNEINKSF